MSRLKSLVANRGDNFMGKELKAKKETKKKPAKTKQEKKLAKQEKKKDY
jgi:hypothetical protein